MSTNDRRSRAAQVLDQPAVTVANPLLLFLQGRLEQRGGSPSAAFRLDLRHSAFGPLRARSYMTLRDPAAPGWPQQGTTTSDRQTAERWLANDYLPLVTNAIEKADLNSISAAADRYLGKLAAAKGEAHNTYKNRLSIITTHIKPGLGRERLQDLDREKLQKFLTDCTVFVARNRERKRASTAVRGTIRDTLGAIWKSEHPGKAPPFGGLRLPREDHRAAEVDTIRAGKVGVGHTDKGYTHEELVRVLVAAMWYDQQAILRLPNVIETTIPNTAGMIASLICGAMRQSELRYWRWCHIDEQMGCIWVPGTKNEAAARWAPLQYAFLPWAEWMMAQYTARGMAISPERFVAPARWKLRRSTDPRTPGSLLPSGSNTYDRRIGVVQIVAGLKRTQKTTHIFRGTHITWAKRCTDVDQANIDAFVGHSAPFGEVSSDYVDSRPVFIADEYRRYIPIPSPAEIAALVPSFSPTVSLERARQLYDARRSSL